ncbi:nitronate monooxygenase, partial [Streptomyces sp. NPDC046727]|uniref:nitronate monooxygenase n=1 Tax=Streptomyces sp. NPDC046727 TaxID=3155373 RepID=UPI0033C9F9AB
MTSPVRAHDLILCLTPFGEPDAGLAAAASAAGALGILDLGTGDRRSREQLSRLSRAAPGPFGIRVTGRCALTPADLGGAVDTVVLTPDAPWTAAELPAQCRVLADVTDLAQARAAVRAGARGLIARGGESGGRVGELSTFVLLQQLLADDELSDIPVWACGGVGPRTAAAAVAGGAAGVVLDSQLALLAESELPETVRSVLRSLDGSETVVLGGHRVLRRRGPDAPQPPADDPEAVAALLGARELRGRLLPVGQDGFLAARFAERWRDVRGVVRGLSAAVAEVTGPAIPTPRADTAVRSGAVEPASAGELSSRFGASVGTSAGEVSARLGASALVSPEDVSPSAGGSVPASPGGVPARLGFSAATPPADGSPRLGVSAATPPGDVSPSLGVTAATVPSRLGGPVAVPPGDVSPRLGASVATPPADVSPRLESSAATPPADVSPSLGVTAATVPSRLGGPVAVPPGYVPPRPGASVATPPA